jgi:hypothetical protein
MVNDVSQPLDTSLAQKGETAPMMRRHPFRLLTYYPASEAHRQYG